jgi:hypothetical protein
MHSCRLILETYPMMHKYYSGNVVNLKNGHYQVMNLRQVYQKEIKCAAKSENSYKKLEPKLVSTVKVDSKSSSLVDKLPILQDSDYCGLLNNVTLPGTYPYPWNFGCRVGNLNLVQLPDRSGRPYSQHVEITSQDANNPNNYLLTSAVEVISGCYMVPDVHIGRTNVTAFGAFSKTPGQNAIQLNLGSSWNHDESLEQTGFRWGLMTSSSFERAGIDNLLTRDIDDRTATIAGGDTAYSPYLNIVAWDNLNQYRVNNAGYAYCTKASNFLGCNTYFANAAAFRGVTETKTLVDGSIQTVDYCLNIGAPIFSVDNGYNVYNNTTPNLRLLGMVMGEDSAKTFGDCLSCVLPCTLFERAGRGGAINQLLDIIP